MGLTNVLPMNAGNTETSYAKNSVLQKAVILKTKNFIEKTLKDYVVNEIPRCFNIADLGCSSGPTALLVVTNIIGTVHEICEKKKQALPEIQVFLNDLADNDFNSVFKMVPPFYSKIQNEKGDAKCFVAAVPGSFYTRLFPSKSIHLVHSSYSLHWLSQVPEKLENNKGNIYMSKHSPPGVYDAYFDQFKNDFSKFLGLRSEEMIHNGRMILTLVGRSSADPTATECCGLWDLLVLSLKDLLAEGLVDENDIDSFNIPLYTPSVNEVKGIVEGQGSFRIERLETSQVKWDIRAISSEESGGKLVAMRVRAVAEPMLATHFGDSIVDKLFERYLVHADNHLSKERTMNFNIAMSLVSNSAKDHKNTKV